MSETQDEDQVEINPEAARLGLAIPVQPPVATIPVLPQQLAAEDLGKGNEERACEAQVRELAISPQQQQESRNVFGIEYKRIVAPCDRKPQHGYSLPGKGSESDDDDDDSDVEKTWRNISKLSLHVDKSSRSSGEHDSDDEFEEKGLEVEVIGQQGSVDKNCACVSEDNDSIPRSDPAAARAESSSALTQTQVTPEKRCQSNENCVDDADICVSLEADQTNSMDDQTNSIDDQANSMDDQTTNSMDDQTNSKDDQTNDHAPLLQQDERVADDESEAWRLIAQGGMNKLIEMNKQYAAGLTDQELERQLQERAEQQAIEVSREGPLRPLMEEDEEEEDASSHTDTHGEESVQQVAEEQADAHKEAMRTSSRNTEGSCVVGGTDAASRDLPKEESGTTSQVVGNGNVDRAWAEIEQYQNQREKYRASHPDVQDWTIGPQAPFTFKTAWRYFESSVDKLEVRNEELLQVTKPKRMLSHLFATRLNANLEQEARFVFLLAQVPLDFSVEQHGKLMRTIYTKLTGDSRDCSPSGSHWVTIGFQGSNPGSDLRSVGMFGVLQVLFLVERHTTMSQQILKLASPPLPRGFPFMAVSLNLSLLCIQMLRSGKLNSVVNRLGAVMHALNMIYLGLWIQMQDKWRRDNCTIEDFQKILNFLREQCERSVDKLLESAQSLENNSCKGVTTAMDREGLEQFSDL